MTKASASTRLPLEDAFFVPSTRTFTVCATAGFKAFLTKPELRGCSVEEYRSTVLARVPSTRTSALPRLAALCAIQATLRALLMEVRLAEAPAALAYLRVPPDAFVIFCVLQAPV
jgi:hypothetical protein